MSPRKRLFSNITFTITTLLVVAFVIWILVSQPDKVRSKFDFTAGAYHPISTQASLPSEERPSDDIMAAENELYRLCMETERSPLAWNADFRAKYPTAAQLLKPEDDIFEVRKPTVCESNVCISLALSTADGQEKNIRRLDILTLPFLSSVKESQQSISLFAPIAFTIVYDTQTGVIESQEVRTDNFSLYYYNVSLSIRQPDGVGSLSYSMALNGVISDKEAERGDLFHRLSVQNAKQDDTSLTRHSDASHLMGTVTPEGTPTDLTLTLLFNDFMYDAFSSIRVTLENPESQQTAFSLSFNS